MFLKRYRGITVRDALALARQELGPDALVLSTRLVARRGWRGWTGAREVEVTVAAEREVSSDRPPAQKSRQREVRDPRAHALARLRAIGLEGTLAEAVVGALAPSELRGTSSNAIRRALSDRLGPLAAGHENAVPVEIFIGPPGGGKTTTIAKLAAQARAHHGTRLGLVAADGFRVGAVEQLRLYADIIGTSFDVARTPDEFDGIVARHRRPVLVDTAGRSRDDGGAADLLKQIGDRADVRTHLVLPAGTTPRAAERLLDGYGEGRPDRIVLTKLDEVDSVSPLLGMLDGRNLPISFVGTGQRVPEDLACATAPFLAASVLGETPHLEGKLA